MSSNEPDPNSCAHAAKKSKRQSVLAPVFNMPTSPNKDLASSVSLKEEHPQMQPVDDATGENQPIFQQASEGVGEGREPSPSQLTASPAVLSLTSSAKNVVASRMVRVADMTQAHFQSGLDMTRSMSAINPEAFLDDTFDQMIMKSTDNVLKQSEGRDDDPLLKTKDELDETAASPELEMLLPQEQKERMCFFGPLGSLPPETRQQASQFSLDKLRKINQTALETHLELSQIISIISNVKQEGSPLSVPQEKLHQMSVHWIRIVPENRAQDAGQIEYRMLILFTKAFQQLLDNIVKLLANIHGLCDDIERKIKQVLHCVEDLEPTLVRARSFQDLSCSFMTQIQEESQKIQEFLYHILENLAKDRPLTWTVGPFVLSSPSQIAAMIEED